MDLFKYFTIIVIKIKIIISLETEGKFIIFITINLFKIIVIIFLNEEYLLVNFFLTH